ncbi:MAG: ribbon-helix-helix protein, CopG family [Chloroflexota bacterium]
MSETPVSTFRLDDLTKARLAQLAEAEGKTMTDLVRRLVEKAAEKQVTVLDVDTKPQYDNYVNLPGRSTTTALRLDPQRRVAYVYQAQATNSTPMTLYHGVELEYHVAGHPDEAELREFLATGRGQQYLREICDGHEVNWDGRNMVGGLTEEAIEASEELQDELQGIFGDKYVFWSADDWLYDGAEESITANTGDEELADLAETFAGVAESDNVVLDEEILPWLTHYRDELRDEVR